MSKRKWISAAVAGLTIGMLAVGHDHWPYKLIGKGYTYLTNPESVQRSMESHDKMNWYQDQSGSAAVFEGERGKLIVHDGYPSLYFDQDGVGISQEQLIVATNIALMKPEERDRALVIGYGTGASSGVAADHFEHLRIYEIREAMVDLSKAQFGKESRYVFDRENVDIEYQDGIVGVESSDNSYNVIFVNIPSPGFKGAEKIWSVETLQTLKKKLKPGGVMNMWMHLGLGIESASIMRNTIDAVFDECRTFAIGAGYYSISCGDGISDRSIQNINDYPEFHWRFGDEKTDFGDLVRAIEIKESSKEWRTTSSINTYNKPLLGAKAHYWPDQSRIDDQIKFASLFPPVTIKKFCEVAMDFQLIDHWDMYCRDETTPNVEVGFQGQPETTSIASEDPEE